MRPRASATVLLAALSVSACEGGPGSSASLETDTQKASYAIGRNVGQNLAAASDHLDLDAFSRGVADMMAEREAPVPEEELQAALQAFSQTIREAQDAERTAASETNRREGEAFLAENAEREGVTTTESGLQYEVLEPGDGPTPAADDQVTIHYRGTLPDGTEFDSSYERGQPATFGVSGVIPGFTEALQLMPVGSKYRFVIPSDLAYGPQGSPPAIGPDQALVFEVEMLEIQ